MAFIVELPTVPLPAQPTGCYIAQHHRDSTQLVSTSQHP